MGGASICRHLGRLLFSGEVPQGSEVTVNPTLSYPWLQTTRVFTSFENTAIRTGSPMRLPVLSVLTSGGYAKIFTTIIKSITIYVVHLTTVTLLQSHQPAMKSNSDLSPIGVVGRLGISILIFAPSEVRQEG